MDMKKQPGFTIVELLIVIVVIAILAGITIVAYRGIRERAVTTAYTSAVDQWVKFFEMELATTGTLPNSNGEIFCLGRAVTDFPDRDGFAAGECQQGDSGSAVYDPSFLNDFETAVPLSGLLPITNFSHEALGSQRSRGIVAYVFNVGPLSRHYMIQWYPQVAGQCGGGYSWGSFLGIESGSLQGDYCYAGRNF